MGLHSRKGVRRWAAWSSTPARTSTRARTWDYLPEPDRGPRPIPLTLPAGQAPYLGRMNGFWLVDGRVVNWTWGRGTVQIGTPLTTTHAIEKPISVGSQALTDVPARLRDLDEAGIDIQVLYPSLFLVRLVRGPCFEGRPDPELQ